MLEHLNRISGSPTMKRSDEPMPGSVMPEFKIHSPYEPKGDQPAAIKQLTAAYQQGQKHQCLLGVTGSGKTFTMAHVIQNLKRPTLVISHNKTLAAQLYEEFVE